MTSKDTSTKGQPVPVPQEPPELIAKRAKLLGDLESQQKTATGTIKGAIFKMIQVFKAMEPGAPLDEQLYQDFKDAFVRLSKDPAALPPPDIFMDCLEYMQERIAVLSPQFMAVAAEAGMKPPNLPVSAAPAAPVAPPAPAAPTAPAAKGGKDGFESSGASKKKMSLGEDAPPPPASPQQQEKKQEELESFKTWMKNPALGKMKG